MFDRTYYDKTLGAFLILSGKEIYAIETRYNKKVLCSVRLSDEAAKAITRQLVKFAQEFHDFKLVVSNGRIASVLENAATLYGNVKILDDGEYAYFTAERSIDVAMNAALDKIEQRTERSTVIANIAPHYVMMVQTDLGLIEYKIGETSLENAASIVASQMNPDKPDRWLELHQADKREPVPFDVIREAASRQRRMLSMAGLLIERAM